MKKHTLKFSYVLGLATIIIGLLIFAGSCEPKDDGDELTNLALLYALNNSSGSDEARTGASSAFGAATAASSGVAGSASGSGFSFNMLPGKHRDTMLAHLKQRFHEQNGFEMPRAFETAITCQDGNCNFGANETINGTANCAGGGTITYNGMSLNMTGTATSGTNYNLSMTLNGNVSFASCIATYIDIAQLPTLAYKSATINSGTLNMNGTTSTQGSVSGSTTNFSSNNNMAYTSSNLNIAGTSLSFDLTDKSNVNGSITVSGSTISMTVNGSYNIGGTVNSQAVTLSASLNTTLTCDTGTGICQ